MTGKLNCYVARVSIFLIAVVFIAGMVGCVARHPIEIRDWYNLDAIRDNLGGSYLLMNDLDSTTPGYMELASPTANQGKGWQPIGTIVVQHYGLTHFVGTFNGQGYEIHDLFINRPNEEAVGLFAYVEQEGVIKDIGVVNATVTGGEFVGLFAVVGLGGRIEDIGVVNAAVTGEGQYVGGLVGWNYYGTVSNSYSSGSVTGNYAVGGLVGANWDGTVSNSYYNYGEVLINGENAITIGALLGEDFEEWLDNDKFLDVNERLSQENGYYVVNNVSDFKQLLAFGQNDTLKFRLTNDLDLADEPNFYIPYLAGEFDGNGHKISNLSCDLGSVSQVGLFGYLASGGKVTEVGVENVNITGACWVGGLVGENFFGTVSNSYSTGSVTTSDYDAGGLVGWNEGTVSESYSTCSVTGNWRVGGLVGENDRGTVSNSYSTGSVTGNSDVGGLVGINYESGAIVSNSFWDTQTSGQATSDGGTGTGKTTAEMRSIATFSGAGWSITAVALNQTNPAYIWNIVDNVTYPFLSWQS